MFMEWKNEYETGMKDIDSQHKTLVKTINRLHQAMKKGQGKEILGEIIDQLILYTQTHFSTEEYYLDLYHHPETEKHKKAHNNFIKEVTYFKKEFDKGNNFLTLKIMNFLKEWLNDHITGMDREYIPFFKDKGLIK